MLPGLHALDDGHTRRAGVRLAGGSAVLGRMTVGRVIRARRLARVWDKRVGEPTSAAHICIPISFMR